MIVKDEIEEGLDDLDMLNKLYDKNYVTLAEFTLIKNRIVDKMIDSLNKEISAIDNS